MTTDDVREVLRQWQAGSSLRAITRATQLDRKTVRRYVSVARAMRLEPWMELDEDVVCAIASAVARAPTRVSEGQQLLEAQRERIRLGLALRLTLAHIHASLAREGLPVSYATLRRFAIDELGFRGRSSRRLAA
jgi:transposase